MGNRNVQVRTLAVTLGDPAGVGPELVLRLCATPALANGARLTVYGNRRLLERVSKSSGIPMPEDFLFLKPGDDISSAAEERRPVLIDFDGLGLKDIRPGEVSPICGRAAAKWIAAATNDTLAGYADALVTAPVNKESLHQAGVPYPGHTEMLAALTGSGNPCMAFHSDRLFISLATIHEPISAVPRLLTVEGLLRTIMLTANACRRRTGGAEPRIGVLALNPHAGEHGLFGDEETRIIAPAIAAARQSGVNADGPLVPDTAFSWLLTERLAPFDGYVAMYHDQALILFKTFAFDSGVNVTLGLPIVRTSPDHGTAFDIAWQGIASPASMASAVRLASQLVIREESHVR